MQLKTQGMPSIAIDSTYSIEQNPTMARFSLLYSGSVGIHKAVTFLTN